MGRVLHGSATTTHNHEIVFCNRKGNPESLSNIRSRCFKKLLTETGVAPFKFHALRHYYASMLIASGENLKEIQKVMGHFDAAFTLQIYGHLFPEDDKKRAEVAESVFG